MAHGYFGSTVAKSSLIQYIRNLSRKLYLQIAAMASLGSDRESLHYWNLLCNYWSLQTRSYRKTSHLGISCWDFTQRHTPRCYAIHWHDSMASRIAPGQNPTGGDHNSHGNDPFLTRQASAHPSFSAETATHTFFFFVFEHVQLYCFWVVYICLSSHACILYKKKKKNNSSKISWHVGPCMPVSLTKISSWQRGWQPSSLLQESKHSDALVWRFHHPLILLRLERSIATCQGSRTHMGHGLAMASSI